MGIRLLAARTAHSSRETGNSAGTLKCSRSNALFRRLTRRSGTTHKAIRIAATSGTVRKIKLRSAAGRLINVFHGHQREA